MKTLLTILAILISFNAISQNRMNEQRVMKEKYIDFKKEYIYFTLHGLMEVNGHTFKNDTCRCPVIYQATLDEVTLIDTCTKVTYIHRDCGIKNCNIIHLQIEGLEQGAVEAPLKWWYMPDTISFSYPYVLPL